MATCLQNFPTAIAGLSRFILKLLIKAVGGSQLIKVNLSKKCKLALFSKNILVIEN